MPITRTAPNVVAILVGAMLAAGCSSGSPTSPSATINPSATNSSSTNIAGAWTVTITASPICTQIPSAFRRRTYAATVTQSGANVAVNLGGQVQVTTFVGTASGRTIDWLFAFLEFVTPTSFIATGSSAVTTSSNSAMSTTFSGTYDYFNVDTDTTGRPVSCNAANHQLTFTRR